ncbi:MAG: hypothetical protein ACI9KD_003039, partial [Congregibacter sp.]
NTLKSKLKFLLKRQPGKPEANRLRCSYFPKAISASVP